jgi:hypothetical protein
MKGLIERLGATDATNPKRTVPQRQKRGLAIFPTWISKHRGKSDCLSCLYTLYLSYAEVNFISNSC